MRGYQESQPFLPLFVQVPRRRGGSREAVRRKIGEEIIWRMPQAKAWRTIHGHTSKGDTLDTTVGGD